MKELRLRHLTGGDKNHKFIIMPLDHGFTMGPIPGIDDIRRTINTISNTPANAVVLHRGVIHNCKDILARNPNLSIIMHLSASVSFSENCDNKVLVSSVEDAVMAGVEAVSVHVNLGNEYDRQMIKDFGKVSSECQKWGMPLLAMVYPRNGKCDEYDPKLNMIAARVAMEIGADIVKINYCNDKIQFEKLVNSVNIPVVIAGNALDNNAEHVLSRIKDAMDVGAAGVAIGRNAFQREDMGKFIKGIDRLVNKHEPIDNVIEYLAEERSHKYEKQ